VDETYVKVAGQWRYAYRAIDQFGQVVDVEVTADQAPVYPVVLEELLPAAWHRTDRVIIAGHALVQNVRRAIRAGG
jgi:transposase, IS6 family